MRTSGTRRMRRGAGCAGLVAMVLAGTPAPAAAATLSMETREEHDGGVALKYTDLRFRAATGEDNDLLAQRSADWRSATWLDAGAPIHIAPEDELINQRPAVGLAGARDVAGCSFAFANGRLVGDRVAVGAASCDYVELWDTCDAPFTAWCQAYSFVGFHRTIISTGDGDDTVRSVDGQPDRIDCGPGHDTVDVDGIDTVTACEVVTRR